MVCASSIESSYYGAKCRGGSMTVATSKMERFVITVNGFKPLTIITKRSILDVPAVLDPPLRCISHKDLCVYCGMTDSATQPAVTCSKLTIETLEQGVKYVQS